MLAILLVLALQEASNRRHFVLSPMASRSNFQHLTHLIVDIVNHTNHIQLIASDELEFPVESWLQAHQTHSVREAKRNRTGQRLPEVARFELETD